MDINNYPKITQFFDEEAKKSISINNREERKMTDSTNWKNNALNQKFLLHLVVERIVS